MGRTRGGARAALVVVVGLLAALLSPVRAASADPTPAFSVNGDATSGGLVPGQYNLGSFYSETVGTIWSTSLVQTAGLHVRFTAENVRYDCCESSGGDGSAFAFLDPQQPETSVGSGSGGLGIGGLPVTGVTLDTKAGSSDPSSNFIGITDGTTDEGGNLAYSDTAPAPTQLRSGKHLVDVEVTLDGRLVVQVDAEQVLDVAAAVPPVARIGFAAANGYGYDRHYVGDISLYRTATPDEPTWSLPDLVLRGSAALADPRVVLTTAAPRQSGAAWVPHVVPAPGLRVRARVSLGGGTSGDGMAMAFWNAPQSSPGYTVGTGGGGLGAGGLGGIVVGLDTYKNGNGGDPSYNFVGLSRGATTSDGQQTLRYLATADVPASLREGSHLLDVQLRYDGRVVVRLDGTKVLDVATSVPRTVAVGLTGATGGLDDKHVVKSVRIDRLAPPA